MLKRYACTRAELSCIIGNLFVELSPPCEHCGEDTLERFPKKYRFTLVNRIQDKAVDIYECALEANELNLLDAQEFKERQRLQAKAMTYCKELLFFIELSHEQGFISTSSCEYWSKLVLDVKYMLAAWKKRDRARG